MAAATSTATYTFACYPSDFGDAFEGLLMDVPTTQGEDAAARRAWWSAFHMLGPRGFEPEDFRVCVWDATRNEPGELVESGGIVGRS